MKAIERPYLFTIYGESKLGTIDDGLLFFWGCGEMVDAPDLGSGDLLVVGGSNPSILTLFHVIVFGIWAHGKRVVRPFYVKFLLFCVPAVMWELGFSE